ncbi:formate dehydrogenase [Bosea caraganae]|uniref:Formate dehydrogenase n=1 Tax=Bosea caraganae TaxID=2763117 RepID=A0A370LD86_9HYPH|nr:formate dehydrogenase subunit delta [Bosea caraganae]RDJ27825.1 formate dehydrogenase [Bosea caraganae]RDJ29838.1 formate dehydrogenase [Bosea caraganae]
MSQDSTSQDSTSQDSTSHDTHDHRDPAAARAANLVKLGQMASQIADFFKSYPEDQAVPAIADHINQSWGRRMRGDFLATYHAEHPDLPPLVRKAIALVRPPSPGV